jgi:hypothetical protein
VGTTDPRGVYTPSAGETGYEAALANNFALFATLAEQAAAIAAAVTAHAAATASFSKGAAFLDPAGVAVATVAAWRAPFACTVTNIRGYRVGGTGATINAYKNTTGSPLRSSALSVSSTSTWVDGGAVQNTAFPVGTTLLVAVISVTGSPTQISVQVDFTRD